jgi:hypothetical protein
LKIWGDPPKVKINTPKQNAWRERRHESRAAQKHKIDDNAPFDGLLVNRFCRRFRTPDCLNAAWAYNRRICSASAPSHAHCNSYLKLIFPAWKLKILQVYDISTATPLRGLKAKFFSIFPPRGAIEEHPGRWSGRGASVRLYNFRYAAWRRVGAD